MAWNKGYLFPAIRHGAVTITTEYQVKPHKGFAPEAIHVRNSHNPRTKGDPPEPFTATPPDWTRGAACIGRWDAFDDPDTATFLKVCLPLCQACPVAKLCLEAKMAEEGSLGAKYRVGVAGGTRPRDRVQLVSSPPPDTCPKGHEMGRQGSYFVPSEADGSRWRCKRCEGDRKAGERARKRAQREVAA